MPTGVLDGGPKVGCFLISERLPLPLPLILGEHLHAIETKSNSIEDGQMHTAGDTEMTANEHLVHLAVLIRKQRKQRCCGACGMDA